MTFHAKTEYLDCHGSRLRKDVKKIFQYFLVLEHNDSSNCGCEIKFRYPHENSQSVEDEMAQKSLPFCFPFNMTSSKLRGGHFTFTFTDLDGNFQFGFCKYFPSTNTCYCIGSMLPWFEIFYKILNYSHELLINSGENGLNSFLDNLFQKDKPGVKEKVFINQTIVFDTPCPTSLASIPENRNISEYTLAVDKSLMLQVFASMMNERRIVFTSSHLSTLTACVYSAEALLRPMHWQHIFIPVLPPCMIDHVYAPMPFIIGVHSSIMPQVEKMISQGEEIAVLYIDDKKFQSFYDDLDELPSDSVLYLNSLLKKPDIRQGTNLSLAYLKLQARLLGPYRSGIRLHDNKDLRFDQDYFLESFKSTSQKEFYKNLSQLQCFKEFVEGRIIMLNSGVGFSGSFEQEINNLDYIKKNDWMNVAKKGGNVLMSQVKKARHNMKNLSNQLKNPNEKPQFVRSKTLAEDPKRLRPTRPPSSMHSARQQANSVDDNNRRKVPKRPPPPRPPPPKLTKRQSSKIARTRVYTPLDFKSSASSSDDVTPSDEKAPHHKMSRTFSDAFHLPDTSIVDDMQNQFDEIQKNMSSLTSSENNSPDKKQSNQLLIDFSDDTTETSVGANETNKINKQPNDMFTSPLSSMNDDMSLEPPLAILQPFPYDTALSKPFTNDTSPKQKIPAQENNFFETDFTATTKKEENPFDSVFSSASKTTNEENLLIDSFNNFDPYSPVSYQHKNIPPKKEEPFKDVFTSFETTAQRNSNPKSMTLPAKNRFAKTNPFSSEGSSKPCSSGNWDLGADAIARSGSESGKTKKPAQDVFSDLLSMWKDKEGM